MERELTIGLFDPGMSPLHRTGLAGLYMTLRALDSGRIAFDQGRWRLSTDAVTLFWNDAPKKFLSALLERSFGIDKKGLVDFAAHRGHPMGDLQKVHLSEAIRMTFLQHNKQNRIPKGTAERTVTFEVDEKTTIATFKPFVKPYAHATATEQVLDQKGDWKRAVEIKGWLFPGAQERHASLAGTEIEETPARTLCLLFAPTAVLFFRLSHYCPDGKFDAKRGTAIVVPHVTDMEAYARCFGRYLQTPVERLHADGLGEAGLAALLTLRADQRLTSLGVDGCTIFTIGSVTWVTSQQSRTGVETLEGVDEAKLDLFDSVCRCLLHFLKY